MTITYIFWKDRAEKYISGYAEINDGFLNMGTYKSHERRISGYYYIPVRIHTRINVRDCLQIQQWRLYK